jgi:carlactone synthase/all-trans-10'-apo-beta-carotenal 13,14-cleaving dioxygenase
VLPDAGEPQFIPQPGGVKEDDGVVLSPCVGPDGKAFVLLMDASSWEELARAELPYSTPYRFHGVWLVGRA